MGQMRNVVLIIAVTAGMAIATVTVAYFFDFLHVGSLLAGRG